MNLTDLTQLPRQDDNVKFNNIEHRRLFRFEQLSTNLISTRADYNKHLSL